MTIKEEMARSIYHKLQRAANMSCSKWAATYRIMGEPFPGAFSYKYHPWLLEMHDADEDTVVGQKAAQMGYTEWALNTAFYRMDIHNQSVLYVLPTASDATDFSAGRFNPALDLSKHLKRFFSDVNNVGLKRAGSTVLYVRGSHSRSKLKSIPTPIIILDEVDEMPEQAQTLVQERQSGQRVTKTLKLSTPTYFDVGINKDFNLSTQDYFFFRCPACNRYITFEPKKSLVITADNVNDPRIKDSHYICTVCKATLVHENKHEFLKHKKLGGTACFISSHTQRAIRGFHVNQYYSSAKVGGPEQQAIAQLRAVNDDSNTQELYNSKYGTTYEPKGARVNREQVVSCFNRKLEATTQGCGKVRTLGIDVGGVLHMVVKEWYYVGGAKALTINERWHPKIIYIGTSSGDPDDFSEAEKVIREFNCVSTVVDSEPERRAALQFAQKLFGHVYLCDYQSSQNGREIKEDLDELSVKVNRTSWLDLTLSRYKNRTVSIPSTIVNEQFIKQICEPLRVLLKDKWGNSYATYINSSADHYAHADNYCEIAFALARFNHG